MSSHPCRPAGTAIQIVTRRDGHKFGVSCTEANGRVGGAEVERVLEKLRPHSGPQGSQVRFADAAAAAPPAERTVLLLQLELPPEPIEAAVRGACTIEGCSVAFKPSPLPRPKVRAAALTRLPSS